MTIEKTIYLLAYIGLNLAAFRFVYYQGVTHGLYRALLIIRQQDNNH